MSRTVSVPVQDIYKRTWLFPYQSLISNTKSEFHKFSRIWIREIEDKKSLSLSPSPIRSDRWFKRQSSENKRKLDSGLIEQPKDCQIIILVRIEDEREREQA